MAPRRQQKNRPLRLHRQARIPKSVKPKIDQINRLIKEIGQAYRHFGHDPAHWRDGPARRRLETNRQRLADLLELLQLQAPDQAAHITQLVTQKLTMETQT